VSLASEEIYRKLLHGFALILPAAIFYGPDMLGLRPHPIDQTIISLYLGVVLVFSLSIEALRLRKSSFSRIFNLCFGSMLRSEEAKQLTGATYIFAGSFFCSLMAINGRVAAASAFLALTLFILGDAAAALVGKSLGRTRIGGKTLEGALGCFTLCFLLSFGVFPILPDFTSVWGEIFWTDAFFLSAMVAILELFPVRVGKTILNDNLYVPAITTLAAIVMGG
jgi:dolichol kinase